jgi:hypothetical protein
MLGIFHFNNTTKSPTFRSFGLGTWFKTASTTVLLHEQ